MVICRKFSQQIYSSKFYRSLSACNVKEVANLVTVCTSYRQLPCG